MPKKAFFSFIVFIFILLPACTTYRAAAPVRDVNVRMVHGVLMHRVEPGETLYSIAWRYDRDYLELAKLNGLTPPYQIHPGENIHLSGPAKRVSQKISKQIKHRLVVRHRAKPIRRWNWPVLGKLTQRFSLPAHKGIEITGAYGAPVFAAASGQVVYAGHGIRGYGNLLIIKHNDNYLSAYAYNSQLLVKNGQKVKIGQKIAKMGMSNNGQIHLHFEIRKFGKPVNPLTYLHSRRT